MDLTQLANLGEFIGGVAVLVTLVFLVVQLRHSADATRLAVAQDATNSSTTFLDSISSDRSRAELWIKGLRDFSSLTADEFQQWHVIMASNCRRWEGIVHVMQTGAVNDEDWLGSRSAMIGTLRMPGARKWWALSESLYNQAFRDFVAEAHQRADDPLWVTKVMAHVASLDSDRMGAESQ